MLKTTTMSSKGQMIIPQAIREKLHWEKSDEFLVATRGNVVTIKKLHMGDILDQGLEEYEQGKTSSHEKLKRRYGK